jgi:hypothetical protein
MSELTRCNRCTLGDIERHAKRVGHVVTLVPNSEIGSGVGRKPRAGERPLIGTTVLVHPPDETADPERHFMAWLWTITEGCVC